MALIQVSYCITENEELFNILLDAFQLVETIKDEPNLKRVTLRVQHEEIPKEDVLISTCMIKFEGVKPFIIFFH